MSATQQGAEAKRTRERAYGRKWRKNRDVNVVAAMRRADLAALPPHKQPAERLCLGCGKLFDSKWCGNRLCGVCAS